MAKSYQKYINYLRHKYLLFELNRRGVNVDLVSNLVDAELEDFSHKGVSEPDEVREIIIKLRERGINIPDGYEYREDLVEASRWLLGGSTSGRITEENSSRIFRRGSKEGD